MSVHGQNSCLDGDNDDDHDEGGRKLGNKNVRNHSQIESQEVTKECVVETHDDLTLNCSRLDSPVITSVILLQQPFRASLLSLTSLLEKVRELRREKNKK